jgi:hypothetical protein
MHDYTVRLIHEDRMAQLVREADAFRLASAAGNGHARLTGAARVRRVLRLVATRWNGRIPRRAMRSARPGDVRATSAAE